MKKFGKTLLLLSLSLLVLTSCSPEQGVVEAEESVPDPAISESISPSVDTLLVISQLWVGDKVTLSIVGSDGELCDSFDPSPECEGFYIGWSANFSDQDRIVEYGRDANTEVSISGLQIGDQGTFMLMYQENFGPDGSAPERIKEFGFEYDY